MQQLLTREAHVRREAKRKGYLLRKSRRRYSAAEDHGLYVLVGDSHGNRIPGAEAPRSAFARGEGMTLAEVEATLSTLTY